VPAARLVLVGDGPERSALERRAAALGIEGRVDFRGALPHDAALRVVAGARAALLSSSWENMPHSVVEALSVGVPVVATAVGGVPEVVRHEENGLLVAAGDAAALAEAMQRVVTDDDLRGWLAAAAKGSVERLDRETIYTRLEEILAAAAS